MAIYEIQADGIAKIEPTTFSTAGVKERSDLQRLLRKQIGIISPNTLVIDEEFGQWEESKRRIDLLGLDKDANLVVIELKRTEDGGHMELQAVRYAAMVSAMTFDRVVDAHGRYLARNNIADDPRAAILKFLGWDEPDEEQFAQEVHIVLASAEFSKELTTAVIWLNNRGLDIRCIRMKPYADDARTLLDVQQVIPLPEAEDYQIQLREKIKQGREQRRSTRDLTRLDVTIGNQIHTNMSKRGAIYEVVKCLCNQGITPDQIISRVPWKKNQMFCYVEGQLDVEQFVEACQTQLAVEGKQFTPLRWFCGDAQLIISNGRTYSLTNQWGRSTVKAIELLAAAYPQSKISIRPTPTES